MTDCYAAAADACAAGASGSKEGSSEGARDGTSDGNGGGSNDKGSGGDSNGDSGYDKDEGRSSSGLDIEDALEWIAIAVGVVAMMYPIAKMAHAKLGNGEIVRNVSDDYGLSFMNEGVEQERNLLDLPMHLLTLYWQIVANTTPRIQ